MSAPKKKPDNIAAALKKEQQAKAKQPIKRKKKQARFTATEGKTLTKGSLAKAEDFFSNLVDPKKPFLIPRIVPTEAVPNHFRAVIEPAVIPEQGWFVAMIQPSLEIPMVTLQVTDAGTNYSSRQNEPYHHLQASSEGKSIDFDNELVAASGARISPQAIPLGNHYGENRQLVESGGKMYLGNLGSLAAADCSLNIRNTGNAAVQVKFGIEGVTGDVRSGVITFGNLTQINASATGNVPCGAFASDPNFTGFCLVMQWNWLNSSAATGSLEIGVYGTLLVGASYSWRPWSFLPKADYTADVLENYQRAQSVSTTGFSCLIQNNQAPIYKGGTIVAAKLAGGSRREVPSQPLDIFNYVSNKNGRDVLASSQLQKGLFWTYHPNTIQDVLFRPHANPENSFLYGDKELPYLLVAMKWAPPAVPVLSVVLNLNLEYITNSIVAPKFYSPVDTMRLMELWYALGAEHNHITENPLHLDDIKKWSKVVIDKTLRNKDFWNAAVTIGKAAAPLLLA